LKKSVFFDTIARLFFYFTTIKILMFRTSLPPKRPRRAEFSHAFYLSSRYAQKVGEKRRRQLFNGTLIRVFSVFFSLITVVIISHGETRAAFISGEDRTFTVTGYYSPLPDQKFYVTGNYEAEKRLNGHGIAGADGTPVFPGMMAAPSSYGFGTKICLPGFGCGAVHDRGGAIVHQGERKLAEYDRLDLWLGYGDEGLARALSWGVRTVEGKIFSSTDPVEIGVNFSAVQPLYQILDLPQRVEFEKNLSLGSVGDSVTELQKALSDLGFFFGESTGSFGPQTQSAVLSFQQDALVLQSENDLGAGRFGPKTREALSEELFDRAIQKKLQEKWNEFHFESTLQKGKRDPEVVRLQEVLIAQEFMDHVPTGYFGNVTREALIAFQIDHGIIESKNNPGAGNVGPKTREILNTILAENAEKKDLERADILAYKKAQNRILALAGKSKNTLVFRLDH
jgi:peptidoglycan hydrolase-like protein with peptidoglycan-binding domain/3D (Asp-Asp-Asp) domain-containing protein